MSFPSRIISGNPLSPAVMLAMAALSGCSSTSVVNTVTPPANPNLPVVATGTAAPIKPGGATSIYVVQQVFGGANGSILQFSASASSPATPTSTLNGPAGFIISAVAVDSAGLIYVGGVATSAEVFVYAAGASGSATPLRTLTGSTTGSFFLPQSLTVDSTGLLYITDSNGSLTVFGPTATGAATPSRYIHGPLTQITGGGSPNGVAVDPSGNLYVASGTPTSGSIAVFAPGLNGNVAPTRTIGAINPMGLATDAAGNLYAVVTIAGAASIVEYSAGTSTPLKTIAGAATGLTLNTGGLRVDAAGNMYVANNFGNNLGTTAVQVGIEGFGPTATGNVAPASFFASTAYNFPAYTVPLAIR